MNLAYRMQKIQDWFTQQSYKTLYKTKRVIYSSYIKTLIVTLL